MSSIFVKVRDDAEVEVEIDRDYGYDSSVNTHDVDWHYVDTSLVTTDDEDEQVMQQIYKHLQQQESE